MQGQALFVHPWAAGLPVKACYWAWTAPLRADAVFLAWCDSEDLSCKQGPPLMQAKHAGGAHSGPVWQLEWLDRGTVGEELLMSASADGRISQWTTSQAWAKRLPYSALP